MPNIDFQDILALLAPGTGQNLIWSMFLYIIFFFALLSLFAMPDKNMVPTLLIASVLLFAIVAKLSVASLELRQPPILNKLDFGMFAINVGMFVFPLIAVGMTRTRKKNRATAPAIITALAGGVYFFLYWLIAQRAG